MMLFHEIQRTSTLEPINLTLVKGVHQLGGPWLSLRRLERHPHGLAWRQVGDLQVHLVTRLNAVVVFRLLKRERQQTLLL